MALTRKFLTALGIEAEKVDEIINAHSETVNALKSERDEAKEQADTNSQAAEQLKKAIKELEDLKAEIANGDSYKEQYDILKTEFENYKTGIENAKTKEAKENAYKSLLKEIGISEKRIDKITKLAEIDKLELDKDGKIKKSDELKKSIEEDWSEFITTEKKKGADTSTPPAGDGDDDSADTKYASDRVAKYMADRYGIAKNN